MNKTEQINKAVQILTKGGIIIFPTDTVWGIGCRVDNISSVQKLYEIRRRPAEKAVPLLVSSVDQAKNYFQKLPSNVESLMNKYWPGGLTVVYYARTEKIPSEVRADKTTIGLRMPDYFNLLTIIEKTGVPILGPSANFHNFPTPTKFSELDPDLVKLVDYVVPGECKGNMASTVIDVTQLPWRILREGAVKIDIQV